jgi:hypothetical protein
VSHAINKVSVLDEIVKQQHKRGVATRGELNITFLGQSNADRVPEQNRSDVWRLTQALAELTAPKGFVTRHFDHLLGTVYRSKQNV